MSGYIRINYVNTKSIPLDVVAVCLEYIGIDKYNNYDQIKSRTELEQEAALVRDFFDYDGDRFSMTQEVKMLLLGSGGVGKSALYHRFYYDNFIDEYDPTIEDTCYRRPHQVDEEPVIIDILDPPGQSEYAVLVEMWIRECNLFVIVYSINNRITFEEIEILIKKVNTIKDGASWFGVIAGNKCDLESHREISTEEVEKFVKKYPNLKFHETSAKTKINHELVFFECVRWYRWARNLCEKMKENEIKRNGSNQCNCRVL